jgi:hypothetical protein
MGACAFALALAWQPQAFAQIVERSIPGDPIVLDSVMV